MENKKPVMAIAFDKPLTKQQREEVSKYFSRISEETGYYAIVTDGASVQFDHTAELLAEQQRTNQLLTDLLQSNWALIEALGEPEQQQEPQYDMDGNRRAVAAGQSASLDLP